MNLRPCFDEPPLPLGKIATNPLKRVDREDADIILIVSMDVRPMVRRRRLGEHADDDSETTKVFPINPGDRLEF